ncbi:MAG TPA: TIGR03067 domain-containing protein [Gemmataceae bacterium]|nr:TIGR03067 domain-containing protein [Gemmataceae bacterium]
MSRTLVPAALLMLFAAPAGAAPKLKEKGLPPAITGEWLAESRTSRGQAVGVAADGVRLVFRPDGTYTWRLGDHDADPFGHKFSVNPKTDPAEIDFAPREKAPYLGVFKIDKDRLTLCYTLAGNPRPTAFEAPAGTRSLLYVFRRATKD